MLGARNRSPENQMYTQNKISFKKMRSESLDENEKEPLALHRIKNLPLGVSFKS